MPTFFKTPTLGLLVGLLMFTFGGTAVANDLYDTIDGLRAGDGECAMRKPMPSLKPQDALERAARRLARGDSLEKSLAAEGYRAKTASVLSLSGDEIESKAAEILATQAYCPQWENAAISEVGIYTDARQMWIVLAAPFAAQMPTISTATIMPSSKAGMPTQRTKANNARAASEPAVPGAIGKKPT